MPDWWTESTKRGLEWGGCHTAPFVWCDGDSCGYHLVAFVGRYSSLVVAPIWGSL